MRLAKYHSDNGRDADDDAEHSESCAHLVLTRARNATRTIISNVMVFRFRISDFGFVVSISFNKWHRLQSVMFAQLRLNAENTDEVGAHSKSPIRNSLLLIVFLVLKDRHVTLVFCRVSLLFNTAVR